MNTASGLAASRRLLSSPLRAALHRLLLIGLRPPRLPHAPDWSSRRFAGQPLQAFPVRGLRGQALAAWVVLPPGSCALRPAPAVVAVHGWGVNASTLSLLIEPLVQAGLAVVLFDVANHGASSTEDFSSLPRFAEDLAAVLDALHRIPAVDASRVAGLGHSVGAGAVLLHAARHGGLRAVVSLSAFAHPREVMQRWLDEHRIPRRWIGAAILQHVQDVIGERFDRIAPEHQLPKIDCPVLLVHGARDRTVPLSDAHRLKAALRLGELLVVDADHDLRAALKPHEGQLVCFLRQHCEPVEPPQ